MRAKRLRLLSGLFLIVLFMNYYGCSTFFMHTHQTPFGPITHSHPFKGAHSHTTSAYVTISLLTKALFFTTFTAFAAIFLCIIGKLTVTIHLLHTLKHLQHIFLRGPPLAIELF